MYFLYLRCGFYNFYVTFSFENEGQSFSMDPMKLPYLLSLKMLSVTLVSDPKAATFINEMTTGSCLWSYSLK